jgi:hypothetical protein
MYCSYRSRQRGCPFFLKLENKGKIVVFDKTSKLPIYDSESVSADRGRWRKGNFVVL